MDSAIGSVAARREIEAQAEALALKFGGPPSDLVSIAGAVGIQHIGEDNISPAAVLLIGPVQGTWAVTLRGEDAYVRRRFSLAHEIAHLALGILGDEQRYMGEVAARRTRTPEEAACDYFAGGLLMPRAWMVRAAETVHPLVIPNTFRVSRDAARIRLEQLGLYAIAKMV